MDETPHASPGPVSAPFAAFWEDVYLSAQFFGVLADIVRSTDTLANAVAEQLLSVARADHPDRSAWEESLARPDRRWTWFRERQELLLEFLITRGVDQFLTYVARLLASVYRTKPEMLRSSEQVRIDDVLRFSSMEDLIEFLAEEQVNRLAYKSLADLAKYLEERLGFAMFGSDEERMRAIRIVELRNLIVHNGRVANRIYLSRVASAAPNVGTKVPIGVDTLHELIFLVSVGERMDDLAGTKFGIARKARPAPARISKHERAALASTPELGGIDASKVTTADEEPRQTGGTNN